MQKRIRVALYGDSLFLHGIARSLEGTPELEVIRIPIDAPEECLPDEVSGACLLAFDIQESPPMLLMALFKETPNLTLLALDPEGDQLVVLSPQVSGARTTGDLMEVILKYGTKVAEGERQRKSGKPSDGVNGITQNQWQGKRN